MHRAQLQKGSLKMVSASEVPGDETFTCNVEGRGFGVPCAPALIRMFISCRSKMGTSREGV